MNLKKIFSDVVKKETNKKETSYLSSGSVSLLCYELFQQQKSITIIVENYDSLLKMEQGLTTLFPKNEVCVFPHLETLPYDKIAADKETLGLRLETMQRIAENKKVVLITTLQAVLQKLPQKQNKQQQKISLQTNQIIERKKILTCLQNYGYHRVEQVEMKGEYAVRGEIIDIFCPNKPHPIRFDFFDDCLEKIKLFDINTQNSIKQIDKIDILPALENSTLFSSPELLKNLIQKHKNQFSKENYDDILEEIENNQILTQEKYIPYLCDNNFNIIDYFATEPIIIVADKQQIENDYEMFFDELKKEYELALEQKELTPEINQLFFTWKEFLDRINNNEQYHLNCWESAKGENFVFKNLDHLHSELQLLKIQEEKKHNLILFLEHWKKVDAQVFISASSGTNYEKIKQLLDDWSIDYSDKSKLNSITELYQHQWENRPILFHFSSAEGFKIEDKEQNPQFVWITEQEIFKKKQKHKKQQAISYGSMIRSLEELNIDDYVVNLEYGIGQYKGLKTMEIEGVKHDYILIYYKNDDKIYVPIERIHLIQRYASAHKEFVSLNQIGDKRWQNTKGRITKEIEDITEELIELYSKRKADKGIQFDVSLTEYKEFENAFPYQFTDDQEKSMNEIIEDMGSEMIMDRLICGDVGFGKTELAMRAACICVLNGYQVALLAPTTLLAQQHYYTFTERFKQLPVTINIVSRLKYNKEIKETTTKLREHKVDILIGTHRLLSNDIQFKQLGLLIIDEEQRFGVKHKEKIKHTFKEIETLNLSATPIPRTLQMSLTGFRDISVINTPPINRRAIRTRVLSFNNFVIREAVEREIRRKGQVYFLHNRVESIIEVQEYLSRLLPNVRIVVAHGQMDKKELEKIMIDFVNKKYTILLSTTIIESGLDIPNVNTIIINNAHALGLSQLYQLRGRVGRSERQAYAYLLYPKKIKINKDSKARLKILQEITDLASGFKIAAHDLELRGTGNLLGTEQSGNINEVGYELYLTLIEDAIEKIKNRENNQSEITTKEIQIQTPFEAFFPSEYIASQKIRLQTYKDVAVCKTPDQLFELQNNVEDRFGTLPTSAVNLFKQMEIRLLSQEILVEKIDVIKNNQLQLVFNTDFQPNLNDFFQFLTQQNAQFVSDRAIVFNYSFSNHNQIFTQMNKIKTEFFNK